MLIGGVGFQVVLGIERVARPLGAMDVRLERIDVRVVAQAEEDLAPGLVTIT